MPSTICWCARGGSPSALPGDAVIDPLRAAIAARLLLVAAAPVARRPADACDPPPPVTDLGERYELGALYDPAVDAEGSVYQDVRAGEADIKYIRALVRVRNPPATDWFLTVRDVDRHPMATWTARDFAGSGTHWTGRIPGSRLTLDFDAVGQASGVTDDTRRLGDHVGFLMSSDGKVSWACSGVAVGTDLFMTNWHCGAAASAGSRESAYWTAPIRASTIVDMSWDDDETSNEYRVADLVAAEPDLDVAILRMVPLGGSAPLRPVRINPSLPADNTVSLIHHPEAERKLVSPRCKIVDQGYPNWRAQVANVDFTHKCDTEAGSSGAPVFNDQGDVVGLHHLGFTYDSATCGYKDKTGQSGAHG